MSLLENLTGEVGDKEAYLVDLNAKRAELSAEEKLFAEVYGGDSMQALMKRFGPKLAKYGAMFGLPTGLLAGAADPGAFSGVFDAVGKVFSLFGLG